MAAGSMRQFCQNDSSGRRPLQAGTQVRQRCGGHIGDAGRSLRPDDLRAVTGRWLAVSRHAHQPARVTAVLRPAWARLTAVIGGAHHLGIPARHGEPPGCDRRGPGRPPSRRGRTAKAQQPGRRQSPGQDPGLDTCRTSMPGCQAPLQGADAEPPHAQHPPDASPPERADTPYRQLSSEVFPETSYATWAFAPCMLVQLRRPKRIDGDRSLR